MKKLIFIYLLLSSILYAKTINIAVSANVSYAIEDIKKEFYKLYPDIKIKVTLGGSGKLFAQIKHHAPYGLFMSANMAYPEALYKSGIAINKPKVYAQGALAYFSSKKIDFSKGIKLLEDKSIKKIAIANPKTAPYGKASVEALKNAKIYNKIKKKFVYSESISGCISYALVATDIGLVAKSSLFGKKMLRYKYGINYKEVDTKLYTAIKQGAVMLKDDKNVKKFYNFIFSNKAKQIFKQYGYLI
ncbi:MAG: molybdate ABC transporter substrate-binding protein [Campylobacterales bacterium]